MITIGIAIGVIEGFVILSAIVWRVRLRPADAWAEIDANLKVCMINLSVAVFNMVLIIAKKAA